MNNVNALTYFIYLIVLKYIYLENACKVLLTVVRIKLFKFSSIVEVFQNFIEESNFLAFYLYAIQIIVSTIEQLPKLHFTFFKLFRFFIEAINRTSTVTLVIKENIFCTYEFLENLNICLIKYLLKFK